MKSSNSSDNSSSGLSGPSSYRCAAGESRRLHRNPSRSLSAAIVLLWNFYVIPMMAQPGYRLVYWDKFGQREDAPRLHREAWLDTWWWDPEKAAHVASGVAKLPGGKY